MDRELVRSQLVGYWIATADLRLDEVAAAKDIAANYVERIAQAAEEDKADALLTLNAAWHNIEKGHLKTIERLEAQVVGFIEDMRTLRERLNVETGNPDWKAYVDSLFAIVDSALDTVEGKEEADR